MRNRFAILTALMGLLFSFAWPQDTTGSLEGRVLDLQGRPVVGAAVRVSSPALQGTRGTVTDPQGAFRFFSLPAGAYAVSIEHPGHRETTLEDVVVRLGRTSTLDVLRLEERYADAREVVVVAERPAIDMRSTTLGANLSSEQYELLPVQRNYRNLVTLLPQANQSFLGDEANFAGATGLENKYFIDGVEATDPFRGVSGTDLPYNFVREVEVRTGGYQAEYRSSLGGVVNAVTRSGGNEFHGQAFGFFAGNRFSEEPRQGALEPAKGDFAQYDFGLSLGGPVLRDKLWFFGAYNPSFEHEEVDIPGCGFFDDRKSTHSFAAKLTWQVDARNNLVFKIVGDPAARDGVGETFTSFGIPLALANPDPYLEDIETGGVNLSLRGNHFFSANFFLETTLSRTTQRYRNWPATERGDREILFIDAETGIWSGGVGSRADHSSTQTNAGLKGTLLFDRHTVKAGLELNDNELKGYLRADAVQRYGPASYFRWAVEQIDKEVRNRVLSIFVQDAWRISERLQINAGLRWNGQFWVGSDGRVAQRILDQYQPRLGFIFQPGQIGSQKVFGSFGRFYQDLSTFPLLCYYAAGNVTRLLYYDHDPRVDPSGGGGLEVVHAIPPEIEGLRGQHYDELSLGYERRLWRHFRVGVCGVYRTLREMLEDGVLPETGQLVFGNPGRGELAAFPRVKRRYAALELTLERTAAGHFGFLASYVLSRNYGNYMGLFNSDFNYPFPNANAGYDLPETLIDGTGLLPNDRTHVFKLSGSYRFDFGLTAGTWLIWQSGTPLNEFGGSTVGTFYYIFLKPRGTAGRTPAIFDLNLRLTYDLARFIGSTWRPRIIADIFHIGSNRRPVNFEQIRYFNQDLEGHQVNPNPVYGLATRYHPPMSVRLGIEVDF